MLRDLCNIAKGATVLRQVWKYLVKRYGNNKVSNYCDISPLKSKVVSYYNSYELCFSKHIIEIFLVIATSLNCDIMAMYATNSYGQEPLPDKPFYAYFDD